MEAKWNVPRPIKAKLLFWQKRQFFCGVNAMQWRPGRVFVLKSWIFLAVRGSPRSRRNQHARICEAAPESNGLQPPTELSLWPRPNLEHRAPQPYLHTSCSKKIEAYVSMTRSHEYQWCLILYYTKMKSTPDTPDVPSYTCGMKLLASRCQTLTRQSPAVTTCAATFNTGKFYILPTEFITEFCMNLRRNSDYFLGTMQIFNSDYFSLNGTFRIFVKHPWHLLLYRYMRMELLRVIRNSVQMFQPFLKIAFYYSNCTSMLLPVILGHLRRVYGPSL